MTDFSPLDSALYESTPEKIAASLRYLRKADAVMAALMPLVASPSAPVCVCGEPTLGVVHRADGPCYLPEQAPPAAAQGEAVLYGRIDSESGEIAMKDGVYQVAEFFSSEFPVALYLAPPAAGANVTPMRQPRADLARLVESINAAVYANGDGLSVTEAIGALELAKLELLKEQEQ